MKNEIRNFKKDEHGDWVAILSCGHTQHVRHNPPWQLRPWVQTKEGRDSKKGTLLNCKKCDEET